MPINDTDAVEWSDTNLSNLPSDSQYIASDLAGQYRNIKSAYRVLSLNKTYERHLPLSIATPSGYGGVINYVFSGNRLNELQAHRKVIARRPDGAIVPGFVLDSSYTHTGTPSTLTRFMFWGYGGNTWSADFTEIMVGIDRQSPEVMPFYLYGGCVRFKNDETDNEVLFTAASEGTDSASTVYSVDRRAIFPSKGYMVHISPCFSNAGANSTATIVTKVVKFYNKFQVYIHDPDGPGTDKTVIFDWFITRPLENL